MDRSWLWRRVAIFTTLGVCDAILLYVTVFGGDTRLNGDLSNGAFLLLAAVVNGYVFGAEWSDKNKAREKLSGINKPQDQEPQQ